MVRRTERFDVGPARALVIGGYDAEDERMVWHVCWHNDRVYYDGIEALPKTGRRELPPRIREIISGLIFGG